MIELVIEARSRDLGGFIVGRVLPFAQRRMVGPFVFFDHFGPLFLPRDIPKSVDSGRESALVVAIADS